MSNQKWVFLKALVVTLIVFNIGVFMGYMLENSRIQKIDNWYLESDLELLNQRIQKDAFDLIGLDCDKLTEENIAFADKIFEEAKRIDKFEKASRINKDIILQHKKYDLLRTLFWLNSIRIKKECKADYHNLVYLYKYNDPSLDQKSKQKFFSRLLSEIKEKQGSNVMLIPIAADNNVSSINLLVDKFNIIELPVILIDEKIKITDVESKEDVEKYLR